MPHEPDPKPTVVQEPPLTIGQAQREIASILARLELRYQAPVVDLSLRSFDITSLRDERPAIRRQVEIVFGPVPGQDWMR